MPLAKLCNENFNGVRTRILMKNICYAGVLAALLDLDIAKIRELLAETYAKKPQLVDSNMKAIQLGYDYAKRTLPVPAADARGAVAIEGGSKTRGHIMIDGNTAAALGCVFAGATVGAWYPITPSTSLMDAYKAFADRLRVDPETGKKNFAFIQAEDELAAIGMVLGASWNGARAFTATSGPGVSLMNEFLGPGVLRRSARGAVRHPARRARPPACRRAPSSATSWKPPTPRTATPNTSACFRAIRRSASTSRAMPSIWPSGCRRR